MSAERLRALRDDELGARLQGVAPVLGWPETPDISLAVADAIRAAERRPKSMPLHLSLPSRRRTVLLIVAAVLALAAVALAAKLVIDIGAVSVQVLPGRPTALPGTTASGGDFGRPVTLERAAAIAGFRPGMPAALGPPEQVWVDRTRPDFPPSEEVARVAMAWPPDATLPRVHGSRYGAVLLVFEGEGNALTKTIFEETDHYGEAIVDGRIGFWTSGPHELELLDPSGGTSRFLVKGNVLIWQAEGLTYRLETMLPKSEAIRLAETTGPATFPET
jgi:hypothetical protein